MQEIISIKNAKVKYLFQLIHKSVLRKKQNEFVIEGVREVEMALKNTYKIKSLLIFDKIFPVKKAIDLRKAYKSNFEIISVSKEVFEKLAYRKSTGGVLALSQSKEHLLNNLKISDKSSIFIAEKIEKPGNLGAMLRTTDGAGLDAFILVNSKIDLYNPNVIRSSLGTVFSNKIAITTLKELELFLQKNNIQLFLATLQNSNPYYNENFTTSTAIAVGAEDKGLTNSFRKIPHKAVYIPMKGQADSLNVSVSAAILSYEILRQRNFKKYEKNNETYQN